MSDVDAPLHIQEIRAQIAEAARKKQEAALLPRTTKHRRATEQKQRKGRVNTSLLRGQSAGRDELWTIRARASHIKAVKQLAAELSEPGSRVPVAELMDEAVELLLAKYRGEPEPDA